MVFGSGDHRFELVDDWARLPEGDAFVDVCGLAVNHEDDVYAFNRGPCPVMVFDREGNQVRKWGEGFFRRIHNGCVDSDSSVFCVDADGHTVSKHAGDGIPLFRMGAKDQPSDSGFRMKPGGSLTSALDSIARSAPPFNHPTGVALSSSGDIFVSDGYGNARVHAFSPDGDLKYSWGEPGTGPGQFRVAHGICIDSEDRVWVADRQNDRIQIFDIEGTFLDQWTGFDLPCSLVIDGEGLVYVAELSRRVTVLDGEGRVLVRIEDHEQDKEKALLLAPHGIAVDSRGDMYIGDVAVTMGKHDRRGRTIQKFARV